MLKNIAVKIQEKNKAKLKEKLGESRSVPEKTKMPLTSLGILCGF